MMLNNFIMKIWKFNYLSLIILINFLILAFIDYILSVNIDFYCKILDFNKYQIILYENIVFLKKEYLHS
jgi:hypothetical protein